MNEWKNFGDVSFLSEGGSMVRHAWDEEERKQYPTLAHTYDVLMLTPYPVEPDKVMAGIKQVDVNDYQDDMKEIASVFGEIPHDEMMLAAYCAEYTGLEPSVDRAYKQIGMYSCPPDFFISTEEAKQWLTELGVPSEYIQ